MAVLATLTDPFNTGTINTTPWFVTQAGSATVTAASSGAQCNFPAASTSATDGDISSNSNYDLTNSYAFLQVLAVPSSSTSADAVMEITSTGGTGNMARWVYEGGTLFAQRAVGFAFTTLFSVAYSATTHKWWRVREGTGASAGGTAGNVYWDTSTDGRVWTNRASALTSTITGGVTSMAVIIGGVCFQAETNPGTFKWNNFNVIPSSIVQSALVISHQAVNRAGNY